jgi:hypothetical protein
MRKLAILGISCWSGFLLMSLELLSGRILAPTFGSSIYVWGAVITVYMVALSIGYLIGGRMSMTAPRLYILCLLHLMAGILILPILAFEVPVLESVFDYTQDPRLGSLLSSVILFFLPAVMCGTVAPYAVRLLVEDPAAAGFYAGLQYFFSTAFSAAGTLLTSFYFVLILEVNQILILLISVTVVMASLAYLISRRSAP